MIRAGAAAAILLAAGALSDAALQAGGATSLQTLDNCLDTLTLNEVHAPAAATSATATDGIDRLRPLCPDLEHAIGDSGLADQLPEHWRQSLDHGGLADLSWLLHRYQSKPLITFARVATLYQVARTLNQPQPRRTWWQEFRDWTRQWLLARASPGRSMLDRWFSELTLPPSLMRSILYGLLGAILAIALWIVRRELQAASAGAAAGQRGAPRSSPPLSLARPDSPDLGAIDSVPPREQPALLLRLLVQALAQSGRLGNERSLTHRELGARGAFDDPQQRASFVRISLLAERLLYGANLPVASTGPPLQFEQALADGRRLYAQLLRTRSGAR